MLPMQYTHETRMKKKSTEESAETATRQQQQDQQQQKNENRRFNTCTITTHVRTRTSQCSIHQYINQPHIGIQQRCTPFTISKQ